MLTIPARTVLTPSGWTGPCNVVVDNDANGAGVIRAVVDADGPTPDVSLVPGFIDVQVNGIDDVDVARASGNDWARLSELLLDQGVTSWCPTLITDALDRYERPLQRIAEAQRGPGPSIIGAHLEGPFLGGAPGAHPRDLLADIDLTWLTQLPDIVRLVTLAPELAGAVEAIETLARRSVVVSLGHSTPSLAQVNAAVAAGATMATHLFNGMSGVHHRNPGLAAACLIDDRIFVGLIADLIHVHPIALEIAFRTKPHDRTVLVTDSVAWRGGTAGAVGITMHDGAPRLPDGTLAGSALTMDAAIRNVVRQCGVSLEQAVRSASTNPAALMGCTDRGSIAVGQRGDLVALDSNMHVAGVWLAGTRTR